MSRKLNGVQVFSATKAIDRDRLGDRVTDWLIANPDVEVEDVIITQSSDSEFHCLSITVTFLRPTKRKAA